MSIRELREKRANLVAQARGLLNRAETESRDLNAEEAQQYDRVMAEVAKLKDQISRAETLEAEERDMNQPLNDPLRPSPNGTGQADPREELRARAFGRFLRSGVQALNGEELRALQADNDTIGGYLVTPQQFSAQLIQALDNAVFMRQLAAVQPAMPNAESLGVVSVETDVADPTWTSELAIGSEDSSLSFGKRELTPHPLAKYIKVSNKLLRAANISVEALIRERLTYKFATTMENAYLNGTGNQQPLGVMVASNDGIPTTRDVSTNNTTTAITADGLMNCMFALKSQYRSRASWLFHTDAVSAISKLKGAADGQYLWHPGLRGGMPDTLLTRPVYESQYMPHTFTAGLYVGILGDFKAGYWIVDALGMEIQRLVELYATTNQTAFIARMESDGMPVLAEAFARVQLAS
jgi:HK97 family phage major capsid protein